MGGVNERVGSVQMLASTVTVDECDGLDFSMVVLLPLPNAVQFRCSICGLDMVGAMLAEVAEDWAAHECPAS